MSSSRSRRGLKGATSASELMDNSRELLGSEELAASAPESHADLDIASLGAAHDSGDELAPASVKRAPGMASPMSHTSSRTQEELVEGSPWGESAVEPVGTVSEEGSTVREHLRGLLEALLFMSTSPLGLAELAKTARAERAEVRSLLQELQGHYAHRGVRLEELATGWVFRTHPAYGPFLRELAGVKPVKLTRAQIEALAIVAYRQPITRPEIDDVRGVDSGPVLKVLLERDLIKILGKREEPGRPILYGTTKQFLEFFGIRSLKELPTLRELTELTDDSRRIFERTLGEPFEAREPANTGSTPWAREPERAGELHQALEPRPTEPLQDTLSPVSSKEPSHEVEPSGMTTPATSIPVETPSISEQLDEAP